MKKTISTNFLKEEMTEKIKNLLCQINMEYRYENLVSNLEEMWPTPNLVVLKYKNKKGKKIFTTLIIEDFKLLIKSTSIISAIIFNIIIENLMKKQQKSFC